MAAGHPEAQEALAQRQLQREEFPVSEPYPDPLAFGFYCQIRPCAAVGSAIEGRQISLLELGPWERQCRRL